MPRLFLKRSLLAMVACTLAARAESIVFPKDAGIVDVTQSPYFAKGDGKTDDTEALQQALIDHPSTNKIIYLPNGVYVVSGPLRWPGSEDGELSQRATILQGQSRSRTIIRLTDYAPGFSNSGRPKALVWTGSSQTKHFRNAVRNLTLHTGAGNPGVIALQFMANKQGCVRDVTLIAGTTGASTGLDLSHADQLGPLLINRVRVEGFDLGINLANPVQSVTMEDVELVGQGVVGIRNRGQVVTIRGLRSTNSVTTIQNSDPTGFITVTGGIFQGLPSKRPQPAIINKGVLFARQLRTPGYTNAVENRTGNGDGAPGPEVREFVSHSIVNIHPAPQYALYLPIEETPDLPWDPLDHWASPLQFGGVVNDRKDASAAIQAAIDSGATTLYFPNGSWTIRKTVEIRGKVRRIIGCEARIIAEVPGGRPAFRIVPGSAPMVRFERLEVEPALQSFLEQTTSNTLVLADLFGASLVNSGKGSVFVDDVASMTQWTLPAGSSLWARQWCVEVNGTKIINEGASLWLLGLKTEHPGTLIDTRNQGKTELLGGLCFANGTYKLDPMFRIENASATFSIAETSLSGTPYSILVSESRNGLNRSLSSQGVSQDLALPTRIGGVALPLFTGYHGIGEVAPKSGIPMNKTPAK